MSPSGARGGGRGETSRLDESDVRVRPGRGTRPRSKRRPDHADADGGDGRRRRPRAAGPARPTRTRRSARRRDAGPRAGPHPGGRRRPRRPRRRRLRAATTPSRASSGSIERSSVLRRTADDTDPYERVVVANASHLVIVTALADPVPRTGFVDRALVAAYAGGLEPVLCLTKSDLADPAEFAAQLRRARPARSSSRAPDRDPEELREVVDRAGVGADRALRGRQVDAGQHPRAGRLPRRRRGLRGRQGAAHVDLGRGACRCPTTRGWVVDTPGIRSFGLAHIAPDDVVAAFGDLAAAIEECPRGCAHLGPPSDPECALDAEVAAGRLGPGRLDALRRVLTALRTPAWETGG